MKRGKIKPLIKPFPKEKQLRWKQQEAFMKLSNFNQYNKQPYLYGDSRAIYGKAKYSSQS
jgi:hypothetical protein|tara:strand:+ start:565 stop:744 length:180 start_codon:yes stop_codon:yes gene_type:complete